MFKLPFYVEDPLGLGIFSLVLTFLAAAFRWAYDRDFAIGRAYLWVLQRRFSRKVGYSPERIRWAGGFTLIVLIVTFAMMAIFCLAIGLGFIQNGDPPQRPFA